MADEFEIAAEIRTDTGKGASRRLRRLKDLVPAVLYGEGKDPVSLSIPHNVLYKALENEAFFSHIITLDAGGTKEQTILKALQRHPAKDRIMHADFMRINTTHRISVSVPIHFVNEDKCPGVRQGGGTISHNMSQVEVSCLPGDLPEYLEVNMELVNVGEGVHLSGIALPAGVEIPSLALGPEHDHAVVAVNAPRGGGDEDEMDDDAPAAEEEGDESED